MIILDGFDSYIYKIIFTNKNYRLVTKIQRPSYRKYFQFLNMVNYSMAMVNFKFKLRGSNYSLIRKLY